MQEVKFPEGHSPFILGVVKYLTKGDIFNLGLVSKQISGVAFDNVFTRVKATKTLEEKLKIIDEVTTDDFKDLVEMVILENTISDVFTSAVKIGSVKILKLLRRDFPLTKQDARASKNQILKQASKLDRIGYLDQVADIYALIYASRYGHLNVVKYLHEGLGLLTTKDVRSRNNEALRFASANGHLGVVKYLVEKFGLTSTDARADNNYALRFASANGHLDVVKYLVEKFGLTTTDARVYNNYALQWSSVNGHLDVVKYLVEKFGLTTTDARATKNYALIRASANGHLDVVKYLVEKVGLTEDDILQGLIGRNALEKAIENGHLEVVKYLVEKFDLPTRVLRNVLGIAAINHLDIYKYLQEKIKERKDKKRKLKKSGYLG